MCEPISIIAGVASAGGGMMQAQAQHQAQQAAVNRSNAIAQQQYQRELQIAQQTDAKNKKAYEAELQAKAAADTAFYKQLEVNQLEANRATLAASRKKMERVTKAEFEGQKQVSEAIKAQGKLLSTGNAGQSFLLQVDQVERALGFEQAELEQGLYDANIAFGVEKQGILWDQYNANMRAQNQLPASPTAAQASFIPNKPIKMSGPSKMGLMGAMIGAVGGGIAAGYTTYGNVPASSGGGLVGK
tara:strand:+ start:384 stop:1115 length:732 start_codon:yes stop_codon:yes gene_type:complete